MKRLAIKKLIVISQSESRSLEVPFENGLNIILGGNKTGKSSIIKSIFTTLGCECKRIETDWKKLISAYLLFFKYGEKQFCVVRQGKKFQIFENNEDSYSCIIETETFHEYSNCLMDILEIKMPCISKDGKQFNVTPPLLFRFQYIDQDEGWSRIADSFSNVAYIKDWKPNTNKYVCGYLDDRYYELQAQKAEYILEKDDKKKELNYNQSFVSRITSTLTQIEHIESVEEVTTDIESLLAKAEELRKMQFSYNAEMTVLENDIYVNQHKLHVVEHTLIETKKDIEFAMTQEDELVCPICGTIYSNGLEEQLNITSDYAHCEKLITELRNSISIATEELEELKEKYNGVSLEIQSIEQKVRNSQQLLSYSSFYKNKGQYEIYESCKRQLEVLQGEIAERVDPRSYKDRGIPLIPTIHLGERASALERKGIWTERGNINRAIEKYNAMIMKIYGFISELKEELKKGVFKFVFERKSRTEKDCIQSINQSFCTGTKIRDSDRIGDVAETKVRNGCKTDFSICTEI